MTFFDIGRDNYQRIDAVESMRKSWKDRVGNEYPAMIYLKDSSRGTEVSDEVIDKLIRAASTIVPAGILSADVWL